MYKNYITTITFPFVSFVFCTQLVFDFCDRWSDLKKKKDGKLEINFRDYDNIDFCE